MFSAEVEHTGSVRHVSRATHFLSQEVPGWLSRALSTPWVVFTEHHVVFNTPQLMPGDDVATWMGIYPSINQDCVNVCTHISLTLYIMVTILVRYITVGGCVMVYFPVFNKVHALR